MCEVINKKREKTSFFLGYFRNPCGYFRFITIWVWCVVCGVLGSVDPSHQRLVKLAKRPLVPAEGLIRPW